MCNFCFTKATFYEASNPCGNRFVRVLVLLHYSQNKTKLVTPPFHEKKEQLPQWQQVLLDTNNTTATPNQTKRVSLQEGVLVGSVPVAVEAPLYNNRRRVVTYPQSTMSITVAALRLWRAESLLTTGDTRWLSTSAGLPGSRLTSTRKAESRCATPPTLAPNPKSSS